MEIDASLVEMFITITNAEIDVARHYLEAHNSDLNQAIETYLESVQNEHDHHIPDVRPREVPVHPIPYLDDRDENGDLPRRVFDRDSNESFHSPRNDVSSPTDMNPSNQLPTETGFMHQEAFANLPEGFGRNDLDEARMMEAVLMGIPFNGDMTRMMAATQPLPPRPASPSTLAARAIREEQDREFEESRLRDLERTQAAETEARQQREAAVLEQRRQEEERLSLKRLIAAKREALSNPPPESDPDAITILFRLPDGARCGRRFYKFSPLSLLFDFVDVEASKDCFEQEDHDESTEKETWWKFNGYDLARSFPRRVLNQNPDNTLESCGLTDRQETLYVERK